MMNKTHGGIRCAFPTQLDPTCILERLGMEEMNTSPHLGLPSFCLPITKRGGVCVRVCELCLCVCVKVFWGEGM